MILRSLSLAAISLTLAACNISGSAQKGPFKPGSTVTSSQLDDTASPIASTTINTQVSNLQGRFAVDQIPWSGWTEIVVTGQYFNELTNSDSTDALTLNAITNKNRRFDTANVHMFTHLAAARIRQRVLDGQNSLNAWQDTQTEMSQTFGLTRVTRNINRGVEQLSLTQGRGRYRQDNANLLLFTGSFLASGGNATSLQALTDDFADNAEFDGVGATAFSAIAIAANSDGLLETLSQNLNANGAGNPPNNGDLTQLPIWINTDDVGEVDTIAPTITLTGNTNVDVEEGGTYTELGATAEDNIDTDLSVVIGGDTVDTNNEPGTTFTITYNVSDAAENAADVVTRTVTIVEAADTTVPTISLIGSASVEVVTGTLYTELGATASDTNDGDITTNIVIGGDVVETDNEPGASYTVTYNVSDAAGNPAVQVTRTVTIVEAPDTTIPTIALIGDAVVEVVTGTPYTELGATASDTNDGDITTNIVIGGDVVETDNEPGASYTVTYNVSDAAGNPAVQVTRTVTIVEAPDTTIPTIALIGDAEVEVVTGTPYTELGATANDTNDGDITANIVIGGDVVETDNEPGASYTVTYNVSDAAGNPAVQVTRTVTIVEAPDTTIPTIALIGDAEVEVVTGTPYTELGATANDTNDGDITANIVIGGDVVETDNEPGATFTVTYNVSDAAGNPAEQVTRTVIIIEAPVVVDNTCTANEASEQGFADDFVNYEAPDRAWPEDQSYDFVSVSEIADIFNQARFHDGTSNGKALIMPTQAVWDSYSDSKKALYLINSERCVRGIRPYEGIDTEKSIDPSQNYAQLLQSYNLAGEFTGLTHTAIDGTPIERLERAGVYAEVNDEVSEDDINADYFAFSENLAWNYVASSDSNSTVYEPVAKAVYGWLYDDKIADENGNLTAGSYGHRNFVLAIGLEENSGVENIEGVISLGTSINQSTSEGVEFTLYETNVYTVQNGFDPNQYYDMSNVQSVDLIEPDSCLPYYDYFPSSDGSGFVCYPQPQ